MKLFVPYKHPVSTLAMNPNREEEFSYKKKLSMQCQEHGWTMPKLEISRFDSSDSEGMCYIRATFKDKPYLICTSEQGGAERMWQKLYDTLPIAPVKKPQHSFSMLHHRPECKTNGGA